MVTRKAAEDAVRRVIHGDKPERGDLLFFIEEQTDDQLSQWSLRDTDGDVAIVAFVRRKAQGALPAAAEIRSYHQRFLDLLSRGKITKPNPAVVEAIARRCPARMMVIDDSGAAVDLYREAQLFPGPSTEGHLLTQHGLRVNGPLFPNPAEGSANLLVAVTSEGAPAIVKLLAGIVSADGTHHAGGAEAEACKALMEDEENELPDVPLVPVRIITLVLGAEHKSTVGRAPGVYEALQMPRYVTSLAQMVPLPPMAVLAGGRRMAAAVEWIHKKNYTHMDIKADNIFVDSEGRWRLGDFGSAVPIDSPVTSTTTWFAPGRLLGCPAKPQYDWHMLAVALVCEVNRNNWKQLLVEGSYSPAHKLIAAVEELHGREGCDELALFLNGLLQKAGYPEVVQ